MHANIGRASQVNIISLFAHKYALLFAIIKNGKEREDTENRKLPETMSRYLCIWGSQVLKAQTIIRKIKGETGIRIVEIFLYIPILCCVVCKKKRYSYSS